MKSIGPHPLKARLRRCRLDATRWALLVFMLLPAAEFSRIAIARGAFPYELEWLEGEIALHAKRFADSGSLAAMYPPFENGRYAPHLYPPVYQMLLGIVFKATGSIHLGWGRSISILSTLAVMAAIGAIVRDLTRRWFPAILAALTYPMFFKMCGHWFDLTRVDSLAYALAAWSAWAIGARRGGSIRLGVGLALGGLAAFTKQTSAFIPAAALAWRFVFAACGWMGRRFGDDRGAAVRRLLHLPPARVSWIAVAGFAVVAAACAAVLGGQAFAPMRFYLYEVPSRHPIFWSNIAGGAVQHLWQYYSFAAWIAPAGAWAAALGGKWRNRSRLVGSALAGASVAAAAIWVLSIQPEAGVYPKAWLSPEAFLFVARTWTAPMKWAAGLAAGGATAAGLRWALEGVPLRGGTWLLLLLFAQHVAAVTWVKIGGFVNNFMPLVVVQAVVAGCCIDAILRAARRPIWRHGAAIALLGAAAVTWFGTREPVHNAARLLRARGAASDVGGRIDYGGFAGATGAYATPVRHFAPEAIARDWNPWIIDGLSSHRPRRWFRPFGEWAHGGQIPSASARAAWAQWIEAVRALDREGGVYLPHQNYAGLLAGVEPGPSLDAIRDVVYLGRRTPEPLMERIESRRERYLLMMFPLASEWLTADFSRAVGRNYDDRGRLRLPGIRIEDLYPRTGSMVAPVQLYERR